MGGQSAKQAGARRLIVVFRVLAFLRLLDLADNVGPFATCLRLIEEEK
jgi:hypothetical protein